MVTYEVTLPSEASLLGPFMLVKYICFLPCGDFFSIYCLRA